ncbi:MAG: hypothetical protein R3E53_18750 [Myxococcota bacterium]
MQTARPPARGATMQDGRDDRSTSPHAGRARPPARGVPMQDVLDRLTRLEALVSIQQLMFRYAECVDLARFEAPRALPARHDRCRRGQLHARRLGGRALLRSDESGACRRQRCARVISRRTRSSRSIRRGDARPLVFTVVLQETKASRPGDRRGRYHDAYHVVDDAWCFAERVIHVDQVGNMSDHLSFDLRRDPIPEIEG